MREQGIVISFYALLTVHLSIIFTNKPTWCTVFFLYVLFLCSTCFGQPCAHHQ